MNNIHFYKKVYLNEFQIKNPISAIKKAIVNRKLSKATDRAMSRILNYKYDKFGNRRQNYEQMRDAAINRWNNFVAKKGGGEQHRIYVAH